MNKHVLDFVNLFKGNPRAHGVWNPSSGNMVTKEEGIDSNIIKAHLKGEMGCGIIPILDDDYCWFAAIDIDCHRGEKIDTGKILSAIRTNKLPLVPCRSKSGGVHLYIFGSEPLASGVVRSVLAGWASDVGCPGSEVFPKQTHLRLKEDGSREIGNWINMPYFNMDSRCMFTENGDVDFQGFVDYSNKLKVSNAEINSFYFTEHPDAPPCIQKILSGKVEDGYRNEAMFNLVVYLKKAFKKDFRSIAYDINNKIFSPPLKYEEVKRTVESAGSRTYKYKCREEPIKSNCDRKTCIMRKFGISDGEFKVLEEIDGMPKFSDLIKYNTDPPMWELSVGRGSISVSTNGLMDFRRIREKVADELTILLPALTGKEWEGILTVLMKNTTVMEAPEEASISGIIRSKLIDFVERADYESDPADISEREALLRGQPVVQLFGKEKIKSVIFRGVDFVEHLKYTKSEELKGPNLWFALKKFGVKHGRIRACDRIINVWAVELRENNPKLSAVEFDMEF